MDDFSRFNRGAAFGVSVSAVDTPGVASDSAWGVKRLQPCSVPSVDGFSRLNRGAAFGVSVITVITPGVASDSTWGVKRLQPCFRDFAVKLNQR